MGLAVAGRGGGVAVGLEAVAGAETGLEREGLRVDGVDGVELCARDDRRRSAVLSLAATAAGRLDRLTEPLCPELGDVPVKEVSGVERRTLSMGLARTTARGGGVGMLLPGEAGSRGDSESRATAACSEARVEGAR